MIKTDVCVICRENKIAKKRAKKRKRILTHVLAILSLLMLLGIYFIVGDKKVAQNELQCVVGVSHDIPHVIQPTYTQKISTVDCEKEDYELLARVVEAEAGNQSELGKRYVIDTILNRCDCDTFPNTWQEVVAQRNQFECVSNGAIWRVSPSVRTYELINEEVRNRTDYNVLYFKTNNFHTFATPVIKIEAHYFSR